MFSKIILSVTSVALVCGCALERQPSQKPVELQIQGGDCLSQMDSRLKKFADGTLTTDELNGTWTCLDSAISEFEIVLSGSVLSPQALRRFIQKYFLPSYIISDGFLTEFMHIKRVLLSGSDRYISKMELQRLRGLLQVARLMSQDVHPYATILFGASVPEDERQFKAATVGAARAFHRLGEWLQTQGQSYEFSRLRAFLAELETISGGNAIWGKVRKICEGLPAFKHLLMAGSTQEIEGSRWQAMMQNLSDGFVIYSMLQHLPRPNWNVGLSKRTLPLALVQFSEMLIRATESREDKQIPHEEWREVFQYTSIILGGIPSESLWNVYEWLLRRPLRQSTHSSDRAPAFQKEHARLLGHLGQRWLELSKAVVEGVPEAPEFAKVINASTPMQWDQFGRLKMVNPTPAQEWLPQSKQYLIGPYVVLDWIQNAYSQPNDDSLSPEQVTEVVTEVLPLLQGFGWLTETKPSIGVRLLREADLFTISGQGNGRLEMHEAVRFATYVLSGYESGRQWLKLAHELCETPDANCLRMTAIARAQDVLAPLPGLAAATEGLTPEAFSEYMKLAESTTLGEPVKSLHTVGDLIQIWMLFQYVESFLRNYDTNRDQLISPQEGESAFVVFGPTLERMLSTSGMPREDLLAFFTFLMKYEATPFPPTFGGSILFLHWKWHKNTWNFAAGRRALMKILFELKKM